MRFDDVNSEHLLYDETQGSETHSLLHVDKTRFVIFL